MTDRLKLIDRYFDEALNLTGHERHQFLAKLQEEYPDIGKEVRQLLAFSQEEAVWPSPFELLGDQEEKEAEITENMDEVGPYNLIQPLGRGGSARVYMAIQNSVSYSKRVALKLVRKDLCNKEFLKRFKLERHILATLSHPNIAKLYDGGISGNGQPYLAMEYVKGEPIDLYCGRRNMPLNQRLSLFRTLGEAITYAHRNLVIHRDLKPSNVLVDEDGHLKLLDFGIAKLLDSQDLPFAEPLTCTAQSMMTPRYASPEQVRGETVSVVSDVYQLGLILYELLTGQPAHKVGNHSLQAITDAVCHTDIVPPSIAVSAKETKSEERAQNRGADAATLSKTLKGDLDAIVLKALSKKPEERYHCVEYLLDDLERYRTGEPVVARQWTAGYRATRFVRRYKFPLSIALSLVGALVLGLLTTLWQAQKVSAERDRALLETKKASQVTDFMINLFETPAPDRDRGRGLTARQILEAGSRDLEHRFNGLPEVRAAMNEAIGRTFLSLEAHGEAALHLQRALDQHLQLYGENHPRVATNFEQMGLVCKGENRFDEAERFFLEALAIRSGQKDPAMVVSLSYLATIQHFRDWEKSESYHQLAVAKAREILPDDHPQLAMVLENRGSYYFFTNALSKAEQDLRDALRIRKQHLGNHHTDVAKTQNILGNVLQNQGNLQGALGLYRQSLETMTQLAGPDHPETLRYLNNTALVILFTGDVEQAKLMQQDLVTRAETALGPYHPSLASHKHNLASTYLSLGELGPAEALYREAVAIHRKQQKNHPILGLGHSLFRLGQLLDDQDRAQEAESLWQESETIYETNLQPQNRLLTRVRILLGDLMTREDRHVEARCYLDLALADADLEEENPDSFTALGWSALGSILSGQGFNERGETMLKRAVEILEASPSSAEYQRARERLTRHYVRNGTQQTTARRDVLLP